MPTYEYACKSCGTHFEVVQSFSDEPLTTCEACGGTLRKVIHPAGILFKGSGFYSTDRRATVPQPKSRKDADKGSAASKNDVGKREAKKAPGDKAGDKASSPAATATAEKSA